MPKPKLYHNPRCSKSREALKLIQEQGLEPEIILYLENPPSAKQLTELLALLKIKPLELMRSKENLFRELKIDKVKHSDAELIKIMSEHPLLIERPIVIQGKKAVVARPPEKLLEIL